MFLSAYLTDLLIFLTMVAIASIGQDLLNKFVDSHAERKKRYANNSYYDTKIRKKQKKDPDKLVGFPVPLPNKKPRDDEDPEKKQKLEPSADKKGDNDPKPNNNDAPKTEIKRNLLSKPDPNPPPNREPLKTPRIPPISVKTPPYFKKTGIFIYQPIEDYEVNFWSMPVITPGDSNFEPLIYAQVESNKITDYLNFLKDSRIGNDIGSYKISDLLPVIFPPAGITDANPTLIVGTEAIGKLIEAFENYSDGFLSNPIWFVPTKIKVNIINGNTGKKRRLSPEIDEKLQPINETIPEVILEQNLFKIPKEITSEQLLEFAGYCATLEGGAEKWESYKENPQKLTDLLKDWKVPTSDDILNETVDPNAPKFQKQKLKIDSFNELLLVVAGTLYVKAGLQEFPTLELPGIKNPQPMPDPKINKKATQADKSSVALRLGNLAGAMSYFANWFNFKLGDFPAEIDVPDPVNPNIMTRQSLDISQALTGLTTLSLGIFALANMEKNIALTSAGEIEQAKNAALKAAECACINTANSGFNTKPKAHCQEGGFNFTSAEGVSDMLQVTKRCREGTVNEDPATLKAMLENIMFGVNIIKAALFKGRKEIANQEQVLRDLLKGKMKDKDLEKFIDDFNKQQLPLTKEYPIKAKIIKKTNGGSN